nr:hypothetical protein CFP56_75384 [Quercus suber]
MSRVSVINSQKNHMQSYNKMQRRNPGGSSVCSPHQTSLFSDKTGACIRISSKTEYAEVLSCLMNLSAFLLVDWE